MRIPVLLSLAGLFLFAGRSPGAASLHVLARTGQAGLTTINNAVSVNNAGLAAFSGSTADGRGSFVADESGPRAARPINSNSQVGTNLQINDAGSIVARRGTFFFTQEPISVYVPLWGWVVVEPGYSESYDFLQSWAADGSGGMALIAEGNVRTDADTLQTYKVGPFAGVGWNVTINNGGQVAFAADQGDGFNSSYAVATPKPDGFNTYSCTGIPFPMLADDGHMVFRTGSAATTPIVLLNYDFTTSETIASTGMGFTALGRMPGISDDGQYVTFYGDLSAAGAATLGTTAGPGIFLSHRASGTRTTVRLAGLTNADSAFVFSAFDGNQRVGVNSQVEDGMVLAAFAGTNASGVKGVWAARFNPANPEGTLLIKVVLATDQVHGDGPWTEFRLSDPVNTQGQIACWAGSGAQQAVLQATTKRNPLIFIPGITGSELRLNGSKLWPSIWPTEIGKLNLRSGVPGVEATDIVRSFLGREFYAPLVNHINAQGYSEFPIGGNPDSMTANFQNVTQSLTEKPTFFPFPYDWRYSNAAQTERLYQYIANIRRLHGGAKVNIVAHSMGGLVARRYILDYGSKDIDHLATVGTPFWGAPSAVYHMLAGNIFNKWFLDVFDNSTVLKLIPTLPGFHELLPSDRYLQFGPAVMAVSGPDPDTNKTRVVNLTADQFKNLIDLKGSPDHPSVTNDRFHNVMSGGRFVQDDWSADAPDATPSCLHICGSQDTKDSTIQTVVAHTRTIWPFSYLFGKHYYKPLKGWGDGTVPLLSAERNPLGNPNQFLAPWTVLRTIKGPKDDVEHTALMRNDAVLSMIDAFLANESVPNPTPARAPDPPENTSTQLITLTGANYFRIVDQHGNDNAKVSDMAAKAIPGVAITYGGTEPWVDISADGAADLTIMGAASDPPIEFTVVHLAQDGTALSMYRYRFAPSGHSWEGHASPTGGPSPAEPVVSVDMNNNGTYEASEQLQPTHRSNSGLVDNTAPLIGLSLSKVGNAILVNLTATDDVSPSPLIRYSVNGGAAQPYVTPLSFPIGANALVKAFAEDDMGNTSGLVTTSVCPVLTASNQAGSAIELSWPTADAYVLEEADDLRGQWSPVSVLISRGTFTDSATIPIGTSPQKFYRLRSQAVTR